MLILAFIATLQPSVYGYCVENTSTNTAVTWPTVQPKLLVFRGWLQQAVGTGIP